MVNSSAFIRCALCGCTFDPARNAACAACPLHAGCNLVCCPQCGYETVDVGRSKLASWLAAIGAREKERERGDQ